jgi:type IV secretory pathway VirD2 relaxase
MADDELPVFRPRFGSGRRTPEDRGLRTAVLARLSSRAARALVRNGQRRRVATPAPHAGTRRVVIKARFVTLSAHGAALAVAHLRYIQRDGVERDGSPGALYGRGGAIVPEAFEQPRLGEQRQFRFIISPEDACELDLHAFVRTLMARVECDMDRSLEWAAVNHYNTDHPHAHVVLRGVDRNGKEVRIDRDYIARGMRERAQELATQELGPRRPDEVRRAREREVLQERLTSLDRALAHRVRDGRLSRADMEAGPRPTPSSLALVARLEQLERMRLAERVGPHTWEMTPTWQQDLRALGERGDIVRQMHAAVCGDPTRYHAIAPGEALAAPDRAGRAVLRGRICAKVLVDELRDTVCAIVETPEGSAYRIPIDPRIADGCRVGDFATFQSAPRARGRPEDVRIQTLARENEGRCVPDQDPSGQSAVLSRRLRHLQALGFARPDGPGAWRVPADLQGALDRLDRERPEHRVTLQRDARPLGDQVAARAPVWLDRLDPASLASYGLGAELRPFLERRAKELRSWAIAPDDSRKLSKLRELERRAVGETVAAQGNLEFLVKVPPGFRGRLADAAGGYAAVVDGQRVAIVPMTRELRLHVGRVVTIVLDREGKVRVHPAELDRER